MLPDYLFACLRGARVPSAEGLSNQALSRTSVTASTAAMTMMMSAISMGPRVGGRAALHASRQEGRAGGDRPVPEPDPTDLVRG